MSEKIKEAYEWFNNRHVIPELLILEKLKDGNVGFFDRRSYIPTRQEWEYMKILIDDFYSNLTDEEIETYNNSGMETYRPSCEKKKEVDNSGYVYFIKADNGLYKIGCSKDVDKRIYQLGIKLPYKLTLVKTVYVKDMYEAERKYHKLHESKRVRGEWFKLNKKDIESLPQ